MGIPGCSLKEVFCFSNLHPFISTEYDLLTNANKAFPVGNEAGGKFLSRWIYNLSKIYRWVIFVIPLYRGKVSVSLIGLVLRFGVWLLLFDIVREDVKLMVDSA